MFSVQPGQRSSPPVTGRPATASPPPNGAGPITKPAQGAWLEQLLQAMLLNPAATRIHLKNLPGDTDYRLWTQQAAKQLCRSAAATFLVTGPKPNQILIQKIPREDVLFVPEQPGDLISACARAASQERTLPPSEEDPSGSNSSS